MDRKCKACGETKPLESFGGAGYAWVRHVCNSCRHSSRRKEALASMRKRGQEIKQIVMNHYGGGKCACCGESGLDFLTLDHTNGDGHTHRKKIRKPGGTFYRWLVKNNFPEDPPLQVVCSNCNISRKINNGRCLHEIINHKKVVEKEMGIGRV